MTQFSSSVQYNDLKGTVSADRADMTDARKWLLDQGLINEDEFVIGIEMFAGENHGEHRDPVSVRFLVSGLNGYQNIPEMIQNTPAPLPVKEIQKDMNVSDFFALFKRFNVTLSNDGMLEGTEFSAI